MKTQVVDFSVEQYRDQGYTGPVCIFRPEEAGRLRSLFCRNIGQSEDSSGPTRANMSAWHHRHRWVYDLATHPGIVDRIVQLLGPDVVMWAVHFWYKEPHNAKYIPWHQDGAFWPMRPKKNVTAWVALGPTFLENGCLRIIPGTHQSIADHRDMDDDRSGFGQGLTVTPADESRAVNLEMEPGEAVFFNEATYHGSQANTSDVARVALSVRFTSPDVKFLIDQWKDAGRIRTFLVRGEDRFHRNDEIRGQMPERA